jgi:transporter family protein
MWFIFALLSAFFAALTSILPDRHLGNQLKPRHRHQDGVVLVMACSSCSSPGKPGGIKNISGKSLLFLVLSASPRAFPGFAILGAQIGEASKVVPVDKFSLVITIVFAFIFLKESVTVYTIIGCALIAGGTFVMLLK